MIVMLLIAGCDDGTHHRGWQSTGTRDVLAHRDALQRLVEEMDRRLEEMPERADKITQRADASILGGFQRGQLGLRMSFRVADREAIPMLHQDARGLAAGHAHACPGIALLEMPAAALARVRGPRLPGPSEESDYARYWDEIAAVAVRLRNEAA
ncbi:hypothetical protein [Pseudonocardia sp. ICBG601]|uniref:hypothetical protein n=1 Tax=Pseudonocardia sp. ICBG601 TaxID=2846759 RepID=UPI001CF6CF6B|nr:hypothetical protein [Pseudonocardia sp. ICBG601]